jgi:hypothetical protein
MHVSVGYRAVSNLRAAAVLWLCATGSAWAGGGGGGEDLASLNGMLKGSCSLLGIPTASCPQLPTISQAVLQVAAWQNTPPEAVRATNNIVMGNHVDAGNPSRPPAHDKTVTVNGKPVPLTISEFPVPSVSMPPAIGLSDLLPALTPLAFSSQNPEPSLVKRLYDPSADTFVYAVASGPPGAQPDTLYFFLEDLSRTNANLPHGKTVAQISFLLIVLNSDLVTERAVPTTLLFRVPGTGKPPCSASSVVGDFNGSGSAQTLNDVSAIGVDCAVVFSSSPISAKAHAIFEVKLLPLVTGACNLTPPCTPAFPNTDPAYFTYVDLFDINGNDFYSKSVPSLSPLNNPLAFIGDELGFTPAAGVLGALGKYIGVAPSAGPLSGPLCTSTECPAPTFSLCANLPGGHGNGPHPVPAVAAFYAIATDGETYLSAPIVPEGIAPVCPAVPPG